jgi:hypothetical protein
MDPQSHLANLPQFKYEKLNYPENVRVVTLRPAHYTAELIDCELREYRLKIQDTARSAKNKSHSRHNSNVDKTSFKVGGHVRQLNGSNGSIFRGDNRLDHKGESERSLKQSRIPFIQDYEALSWCWGQGDPDRIIQISTNGVAKRYHIYEHLYECLRALRYEDKERYLWIDALCIHQADAEERGQQVPRMNVIYGNAINVCVWLGRSNPSSHLAFEFINKQLLKFWDFDDLCTKEKHMGSWKALLELMKRPWFSRRWIVQEISLAKKGTVYCGRECVDWQDFADAVSLFVQVEETPNKLSEIARRREEYNYERGFFDEVPFLGATLLVKTTKDLFRRSGSGSGAQNRQLSLESLISRLAVFRTSEPRDTVYALLSMAKDSNPYVPNIRADEYLSNLTTAQRQTFMKVAAYLPHPAKEKYNVDYTARILDVYQQFITFSIRKADPTRALDIICRPFACKYTRRQDFKFDPVKLENFTEAQKDEFLPLPTWVPDVADLPFEMRESQTIVEDGSATGSFGLCMERRGPDSLVGTPEQRKYSASGRKVYGNSLRFRQRQSRGDSHRSLYVDGFILDSISDNPEEPALAGNIPEAWFERIGWHNRQRDPPHEPYSQWQDFWRTLIANRDSKGADPPIYYQRALRKVFMRAGSGTFKIDDWIQKTHSPIASCLRRVKATIWERRLFKTSEGRLGLASRKVQRGDFVCILYGCSVPVILRRRTKSELDVEIERRADELDSKERKEHAIEKVKKIFDRRKALRQAESDAQLSIQKQFWQIDSWSDAWELVNRLQNFARTSCLLCLSLWLGAHNEVLAATLIGVVTTIHLISYAEGKVIESWLPYEALRSHRDGVSIVVAVLGTFVVLYMRHHPQKLTKEASVVSIVFVSLFPQLLPPSFTKKVKWLRYHLQRRIDERQLSGGKSSRRWSAWPQRLLSKLFRRKDQNIPEMKPPSEPRSHHYYQLIGECYVHGMMEGEAIELQFERRDEYEAEVFEIR